MSKTRIRDNTELWWWYVLHTRTIKKMKEELNEYEYKNLRVCEKWLQIESCRKCLFELLCHYQDNNDKNKNWGDTGEWNQK